MGTAFTKYDDKEELAGALAIVDAKSLYDLLAHETTGGADRRTALDVQVLREELSELSGCIRWIDHMHMPADCLTKKRGRADSLMRLLESGRFGVTEEAITLSSRLQDRQEKGYNRRWHGVSGQQNFSGAVKSAWILTFDTSMWFLLCTACLFHGSLYRHKIALGGRRRSAKRLQLSGASH